MAIVFPLNREQSEAILLKWRVDYCDEGYDFPFVEQWAKYRLNADIVINHPSSYPLTLIFKDDTAAVEFKLRWM